MTAVFFIVAGTAPTAELLQSRRITCGAITNFPELSSRKLARSRSAIRGTSCETEEMGKG